MKKIILGMMILISTLCFSIDKYDESVNNSAYNTIVTGWVISESKYFIKFDNRLITESQFYPSYSVWYRWNKETKDLSLIVRCPTLKGLDTNNNKTVELVDKRTFEKSVIPYDYKLPTNDRPWCYIMVYYRCKDIMEVINIMDSLSNYHISIKGTNRNSKDLEIWQSLENPFNRLLDGKLYNEALSEHSKSHNYTIGN